MSVGAQQGFSKCPAPVPLRPLPSSGQQEWGAGGAGRTLVPAVPFVPSWKVLCGDNHVLCHCKQVYVFSVSVRDQGSLRALHHSPGDRGPRGEPVGSCSGLATNRVWGPVSDPHILDASCLKTARGGGGLWGRGPAGLPTSLLPG